MSSNKKCLLRTLLTANGSCGCGKAKPSDVHEPTPKPKTFVDDQKPNPSSSLTSSTKSGERNGGISVDEEDFTSTTISEAETEHRQSVTKNIIPKQSPKLMDSVAVEKDSEDPYKDFRHSMLQMIFEKEIYSQADLQELLGCFLQLNPPCHHEIILKAFKEICEEAFPKKGTSSGRKQMIIHKREG